MPRPATSVAAWALALAFAGALILSEARETEGSWPSQPKQGAGAQRQQDFLDSTCVAEVAEEAAGGPNLLQGKSSAAGKPPGRGPTLGHARFIGSSFKQLRAAVRYRSAGVVQDLQPSQEEAAPGSLAPVFEDNGASGKLDVEEGASGSVLGKNRAVAPQQLEAPSPQHLLSLLSFEPSVTAESQRRFFAGMAVGCSVVSGASWVFRRPLEKYVLPGLPHCLTWVCCVCMLVLSVKWILDRASGNFPFPLTLSAWHMLVCTSVTWAVRWLAPDSARRALMPALEDPESDVALIRTVLPAVLVIGVLTASMMSMGLYSYMIASVTLLQMVQVFVGPMAACLSSFAVGTEEVSCELLGIMLVISCGALMMVYQQASVVPVAIMLQAAATALDSLRYQGMQVLMQGGAFHPRLDAVTAIYLCSPVSLICVSFVAAYSEWWGEGMRLLDQARDIWWALLLDGTFALLANVTAAMAVERAKALTVGIFAVFKDCLLMWCDAAIFGTRIKPIQAAGLAVATVGVGLYKRYRTQPKGAWDMPCGEETLQDAPEIANETDKAENDAPEANAEEEKTRP